MPKYKLKSGSHSVHRIDKDPLNYSVGDVIELTKEQAMMFDPGRLEEVNAAEKDEVKSSTSNETKSPNTGPAVGGATSKTGLSETEWTAVLSQGVNDVKGVISALDDPDDLKALQEEESKGSNRKMVLDAIEKRLGEIKK